MLVENIIGVIALAIIVIILYDADKRMKKLEGVKEGGELERMTKIIDFEYNFSWIFGLVVVGIMFIL